MVKIAAEEKLITKKTTVSASEKLEGLVTSGEFDPNAPPPPPPPPPEPFRTAYDPRLTEFRKNLKHLDRTLAKFSPDAGLAYIRRKIQHMVKQCDSMMVG